MEGNLCILLEPGVWLVEYSSGHSGGTACCQWRTCTLRRRPRQLWLACRLCLQAHPDRLYHRGLLHYDRKPVRQALQDYDCQGLFNNNFPCIIDLLPMRRGKVKKRETLPSTFSWEKSLSSSDVHQCECPNCQQNTPHPDQALHRRINLLLNRLDEQQRRWYVTIEADRMGSGGDKYVSQITGMDPKTS